MIEEIGQVANLETDQMADAPRPSFLVYLTMAGVSPRVKLEGVLLTLCLARGAGTTHCLA